MILTHCASCAVPLGLTLGKKCGRCSTRYCGAACQVLHWKEGGHDKLCKAIKKAGGAEVYNANKKYTEAVVVAAAACAEDTKGQTCYICTQALHWKTKEGLVRMCACRGTAGFAHVSCLAEQAKILVAEVEENNLGNKVGDERWSRWSRCGLCEQEYHGVVRCALGWACWKMYLGRSETDWTRRLAIQVLGNGLADAEYHQDALSVKEAQLSMELRLGASAESILNTQNNLANTYQVLGRLEEGLRIRQEVYSGLLKLRGEGHANTLSAALNYASSLIDSEHFEEAKALLRKPIAVARRVLGEENRTTLKMRSLYATALYKDTGATLGDVREAITESTLDDLREAVTTCEDVGRIAQRVLGGAHPLVSDTQRSLEFAREIERAALAAREGDVESLCEAVEAIKAGNA